MKRLQDLVDKLQLKVKGYKRQSEEAVSAMLCDLTDGRLAHVNNDIKKAYLY